MPYSYQPRRTRRAGVTIRDRAEFTLVIDGEPVSVVARTTTIREIHRYKLNTAGKLSS
jgi:hypothetical protein